MSTSKLTMTSINDIAINEPSLCIPFVFANITEERIREVFSHLELGEIERIDTVWRDSSTGGEHQRVFIHFKQWNSDENTTRTRQALLDEETIKVVYDDPWFWKISASRTRKPRPKGVAAPRPRIEIMKKSPKKAPMTTEHVACRTPSPTTKNKKDNNMVPPPPSKLIRQSAWGSIDMGTPEQEEKHDPDDGKN